ncbi:MAG: DUF2384 domain-containing protein [Gammaproteobacteria bacterium]|jgi:hypothetical protein
MDDTLLPQLQEPEARHAVIDAVMALFVRWRLHDLNKAQLLGVADIADLKHHRAHKMESTVLARAGHLLAIDRALNRHYAYQPRMCDQWVSRPQEALNGETPLAVMLEQGSRGIRKVRELAEFQLDDSVYNADIRVQDSR